MNHTKRKQGTKIERQSSMFDAAANALEWVEMHGRDFGTARRFRDDEILRIGVGMVPATGIAYESEGFASWKPAGAKGPAGRAGAQRALEE